MLNIVYQWPERGVQKLTGENLKVVWVEFSTLSKAVLLHGSKSACIAHMQQEFYKCKLMYSITSGLYVECQS
jgi:hypothetical protein